MLKKSSYKKVIHQDMYLSYYILYDMGVKKSPKLKQQFQGNIKVTKVKPFLTCIFNMFFKLNKVRLHLPHNRKYCIRKTVELFV